MFREQEQKHNSFNTYSMYQDEKIKPYWWNGITTEAEEFIRRNETRQDLFSKKCNQIMLYVRDGERALVVRYDGPCEVKR